MNMQFCSSCKNVSFSTKLFGPACCDNFNFNSINVVLLMIGKVDYHCFKAIVRPVLENNALVLRFVADISDMSGSELEEFCMVPL